MVRLPARPRGCGAGGGLTASLATEPRTAARLRVTGVVQGVGFRPFVHRLAARFGLDGWVLNDAAGVEILLEGPARPITAFIQALTADAPPLARIDDVRCEPAQPAGLQGFTILPSRDADGRQQVPPDAALCAACEAELFDPANRRYRYPFITCSDCGPRFTVIESMPYDRERTSMRAFAQCAACSAEYRAPGDRRHHSETNSCAACGPRLWVERGGRVESGDPLATAAVALRAGSIVALRGLGGFHLAADATSEPAVSRLRERKHREAKPFAVMVRSLDQARALAVIGPVEEALLVSPARPIVTLEAREGVVAPSVAPGLRTLGVMLAYTPLHHLLLSLVDRPLVMTSGNRSEEPIATGNADARARLSGIADLLLLHDREITARYDDSVARVVAGQPVFLRRARGYAPLPLRLPGATPQPLVAVGAQLKSTFTLAAGNEAFVGPHIGDLDDVDTLDHFRETLRTYRRLFHIEPAVVARDRHPDYPSTRFAAELGLREITVQHHHAHVAAVLAEHGMTDRVVGLVFDGSGYGDDGHVWGGECLVADLDGAVRAGHLRYAPLPGGDLGARRPWRAALGYQALEPEAEQWFRPAFAGVDARELDLARHQAEHRLNTPLTSSMGRLFDAAAAILGIRTVSRYEGHAAMELESVAGEWTAEPLPFPVVSRQGMLQLDPLPLLVALGEGAVAGGDPGRLAAAFHEGVARGAAEMAIRTCRREGIGVVVLAGGVFQNARLLATVRRRLLDARLGVLLPRILPPNDGAISFGQAAVAARALNTEEGEALCA